MTKDADLSRVGPLSCEIGHRDFIDKFEKKIPQVGEIKYYEEPDEELLRHYKAFFITKIILKCIRVYLQASLQSKVLKKCCLRIC